MRLFVLAAGKGTRMAPETHDKPKCLVQLADDKTFVSHLLRLAEQTHYIDEAFIVTGHRSDTVDHALTNDPATLHTRTIYNPFYEVAGPIASLWIGNDKMTHQNFIVCNGDTYYTNRPFGRIWTKDREAIRLCVDSTSRPHRDDMKVKFDQEGRLAYVGKDLEVDKTKAVSTGMLMVKGPRMRKAFTDAVDDLLHVSENIHTWQPWHIVLNALAGSGVPIDPVTIHPHDWAEVDTLDELHGLRARIHGRTLHGVRVEQPPHRMAQKTRADKVRSP